MMKNDITYEYRVFTNRRIDVDTMEVGRCTSKVIKELKPKDKVDGRFFHTSDTDEWFYCWKGELQTLNLKGDADLNAALAEVEKLIGEANAAVDSAKETAQNAQKAAEEAKAAADAASAAVSSIDNKADKAYVDSAVAAKADASVVDALSSKVDAIKVPTDYVKVSDLNDYAKTEVLSNYATKSDIPTDYLKNSDLEGLASESFVTSQGYLTKSEAESTYAKIGSGSSDGVDISGKQDKIEDLDAIREGAAKGATALQSVPAEYVTESELDAKGYLTSHQDITGKQDFISDLDVIRSGASLGATALQSVPSEYVTETELDSKGYLTSHQDITGKQDVISDLDAIREGAAKGATALQEGDLEEYVTETEMNEALANLDNVLSKKIDDINNYITQTMFKEEV